MAAEARRILTEPAVIRALAHPVRLEVLNHLMAGGPATASQCARAVGDTPSNCSYHLRFLARHGLVEPDDSTDGRERPWRATITGFDTPPGEDSSTEQSIASAELLAISIQREQRLLNDHVAHRDGMPAAWLGADEHATYTLRMSPAELRSLTAGLDALIRPYLAATRVEAPADAEPVHAAFYAFPRLSPAQAAAPTADGVGAAGGADGDSDTDGDTSAGGDGDGDGDTSAGGDGDGDSDSDTSAGAGVGVGVGTFGTGERP